MNYQLVKLDLVGWTGLAKDALHVHIGLAVFIVVRLLWRRKGGWWLAWIAALAAALAGEALDIRDEIRGNYLQPDRAHWHDIWNTMVWPTVLLIIGSWLPPRDTKDRHSREGGNPSPDAEISISGDGPPPSRG